MDNIDEGTINDLYIHYNSSLSTCEAEWLCDYLASPNGTVDIHYNAPGCNSPEQVDAACLVGVPEESSVGGRQPVLRAKPEGSAASGYPNPFSDDITLEYELENATKVNLSIYNNLGQQVAVLVDEEQAAGRQQVRWEAEGMPAGIYYYRLKTFDQRLKTSSGKIMIR